MPFEIVRNDITKMSVDAIVNSANPRPVVGLGTDSSIHEKAGPELLAARQKIGPIAVGRAAITPAFRLPAKYVIHTVGPVWDGGSYGEEMLLRSCYDQSLKLALEHGCKSIAFPLIATNNYGFPKDKALQLAVAAFSEFLLEHEMLIYLVVFDRSAYRLSEKLVSSIASYIDDHYLEVWEEATYGAAPRREASIRRRRDMDLYRECSVCENTAPCESIPMPMAARPKPASLKDLLSKADAGFTETLRSSSIRPARRIRRFTRKPIFPSSIFPRFGIIPITSLPSRLLSRWHLLWNWIWSRPRISLAGQVMLCPTVVNLI